MFIVGIDIAKRSHEAIIIAEDGQVVRKAFSFRNNCTGYNLLLEQVRRLTLVKSQIVFAMESTAHYWLALYARLLKDGYTVMVLNPIQSHSLRELYIRKAKTDARDSLIIADLVRFGRCKASNVPQDKILALRELCRSRAYLVDMAADLKRKLIALLDRIFPEYESLFDSVFSKASIAVLSKYSTPQKVKNANLRKLTDLLMESSNGHFGEWKAHQLKEAACSSFGIDDSGGVYSTLLGMFLEQILSLTAQADSLEKQISVFFQEFNNPLTSIPGVGTVLAATILSEIGDITRFSSADKLLAYAGLDPSVKQSGEFKSNQNRMSKRGSPYLRRAIWLASTVAVHRDPMFQTLLRKENIRRSALHECDWSCQQKDDRCDLRCPPGWTTVSTHFAICRLTELHHFHPAHKGSGSLRPFPIYPLYTQAEILSLDKPIADCFFFRPRKRLEKHRKSTTRPPARYASHYRYTRKHFRSHGSISILLWNLPTNGPRSLLLLKVGTHSPSLKESHTRAHTSKHGASLLPLCRAFHALFRFWTKKSRRKRMHALWRVSASFGAAAPLGWHFLIHPL